MKRIYFLGIGGIGMSAIARYYHLKGVKVSGYDRVESVVTRALEELGIEVFYELNPEHLQSNELMIYTPAISQDNVEYQAAKEAGMPIYKRSQILGEISRDYQTVAVAGTHGKTSTSTMMAHVFRNCGLDCTAFLGGISRNLQSNFVFGESELMVVEADEFDRSFLTLYPEMAVITSLDPDHLDIYGTPDEMNKTYLEFAGQVKTGGELLVAAHLPAQNWPRPIKKFGIETGDYQAINLRYSDLYTLFDYKSDKHEINNLRLAMPGRHNVMNMLSAIAACELNGGEMDKVEEAVKSFSGIYRRFEVLHHSAELSFVDDYAHHPSEIEAAIDTARSLFPERKLVVAFQPHLFSRTNDFHVGFAESLSESDVVLLLDIYPAREEPMPGVESEMIERLLTCKEKKMVSKKALPTEIEKYIEGPTVVMTLGAGDIDKEVPKVGEMIKERIGLVK